MKYVVILAVLMVFGTSRLAAAATATATRVRLETNYGVIVLELNAQAAPKTVANFLSYAREGFYTGTIFHRVIKGFMIQGGGFTEDMRQKATKAPIANEADNGLKNDRGTIAMARTMDPDSATAQFFINTVKNDFLNYTAKTQQGWGYCVFGKVVEGMDVVEQLEQLPTTTKAPHKDVPATAILIERAVVEE